ncbi:MAG: uL15 family ribosomal protein [Candidatus Woesearchaeota archaeon]|jgi:large subunit ribosomal protein L15|nr:uL15 family ribosomal protein [Candidatus Woesearchaeota archaeon]
MTTNKRRKTSRQRGSWTHGWGSKKKHRGAGSRGGRGMAGSGKRADTNKPSVWKEKYFGKTGFKKKGVKVTVNTVSLAYLDQNLDKLLSNKLISKDGEFYIIDTFKLGYNKLLSGGKLNSKLKIKTDYASKKAIEKVKEMGGEVILPSGNKEVKSEKPKN